MLSFVFYIGGSRDFPPQPNRMSTSILNQHRRLRSKCVHLNTIQTGCYLAINHINFAFALQPHGVAQAGRSNHVFITLIDLNWFLTVYSLF